MRVDLSKRISFQKIIKAKCAVIKDGKQYPCNIFQLYPITDKRYFLSNARGAKWVNSNYWLELKDDFNTIYPYEETYVLEDSKKDCLGFANIYVSPEEDKNKELILFESQPNAKRNGFKYIGETLMTFIAAIAKKDSSQQISVPIYKKSAQGFYQKCFFEINPFCRDELVIDNKKFNKLIKQNENHTGRKMDLIL